MKIAKSYLSLIDQFYKLPGIGRKSAETIVNFIIKSDIRFSEEIEDALRSVRDNLGLCSNCNNITDDGICPICNEKGRDFQKIMIVETFSDLYLFEKYEIYNGVYHVLWGLLDPLNGVTVSDLKLANFFKRLETNEVKEVIFGLDSSVEANTTAFYIKENISDSISVTRLAQGMPIGGNIQQTDELTLRQALSERKNFS